MYFYFYHLKTLGWTCSFEAVDDLPCAHWDETEFIIFQYVLKFPEIPDMLSGTKIAGQLRKNSSGHATQIFATKSRKFEIPAVRVKRFCKAVLVCRLRALKTSISLGTWFFYRVFPVRISQASLRYCTVCSPIHRSEEFRKTTGALTTLTISIADC